MKIKILNIVKKLLDKSIIRSFFKKRIKSSCQEFSFDNDSCPEEHWLFQAKK